MTTKPVLLVYRKNTKRKVILPTPMFWHTVLHQQFSDNTFNEQFA
jgi:hypothetical protein